MTGNWIFTEPVKIGKSSQPQWTAKYRRRGKAANFSELPRLWRWSSSDIYHATSNRALHLTNDNLQVHSCDSRSENPGHYPAGGRLWTHSKIQSFVHHIKFDACNRLHLGGALRAWMLGVAPSLP